MAPKATLMVLQPGGMTDLAHRLWQARRSGAVVDPDEVRRPGSLAEAYAIQCEIAALSGEPSRGFKVGSASIEAQRALGTSEPASGLLLAAFVHESPPRISVAPAHTPFVEGEFAFRFGRDLPPRAAPYAIADVADAVAAVAPAIEVVGSRFAGGLKGKGRLLVTADCGANIALVAGPWPQDWRSFDLKRHRVAITINGAISASLAPPKSFSNDGAAALRPLRGPGPRAAIVAGAAGPASAARTERQPSRAGR